MSAILVGIVAVIIYAIGVFMGIWIGRSYPNDNDAHFEGWRGSVPKSANPSPKPIIRPSPPGKE